MPSRGEWNHLLVTPENKTAVRAVQDLVVALVERSDDAEVRLLYLHGPSGAGKTILLNCLTQELDGCAIEVCSITANDCADAIDLERAVSSELLIVEDLQHLPVRCTADLINILDARCSHQLPTLVTANDGPARLKHRGAFMSRHVSSRLAAGLVVAIDPMQAPSRRRLLEALAAESRISLAPEILEWLAHNLIGGGRQLRGAVRQLVTLQRLQPQPLCLDQLRAHFRSQLEANAPTMQRIVDHVSDYFQVASGRVLSARRSRDVLLPRQVSMYLARQQTVLSLQKIGKYFGRDHKTVDHACRKVKGALATDVSLKAAVRQLRAELT